MRIPFSESWGRANAAPDCPAVFPAGNRTHPHGLGPSGVGSVPLLDRSGMVFAQLVTGFTLGHSLSLALAAFDVVRLPSPPTEACIALSIAFVAREALLPADSRRHGAGLIFVFGLLHGLGFAAPR